MPKKRNPAFSKKVKKRAPIRDAFKEEFVDGKNVLSVRFTHWENQDYLFVRVSPDAYVNLPEEYKGYPVFVKRET
jgi:hypothetical protein